jgi:hypothetical protein
VCVHNGQAWHQLLLLVTNALTFNKNGDALYNAALELRRKASAHTCADAYAVDSAA